MSEQQNHWQQRPFYWRIPILFGLLGGGLGGLLMGLMRTSEMFTLIVLGEIFGCVPALITGFAAMFLKSERNVFGIMTTVGIGFLVSLIYAFILRFSGTLLLAILGGVSALILSSVVLPKPNPSNN